jgi:uncharacterized membrane protein
MAIDDMFKMNEWEIKRFLIIVSSIQLMMWGLIGLDLLNYHIPFIRQAVGFVYITFVPGILFVRILRLHNARAIEVLLYSIGSSIAIAMFAGAFLNFIFTILSIPGPISLIPLTAVLSTIVLAMCAICYKVDRPVYDYIGKDNKAERNDILLITAIALSIIPVICIAGACIVNFYDNNLLLMLLIIVISAVIFFIAVKRKNMAGLYPFAIFIISFSLLFHSSLISSYINGWDIHIEYNLANNVLINSWWNHDIFSPVNSMLSIVMLAPIYSVMLNLDLTWVFKIVYPLIFSFVPVCLYVVFQKQTTELVATLSCIFFVSLFTFYTEMLALARQQIAELFFVLLILLIIRKEMEPVKRMALASIFTASLVVSHYGISYIYILLIVAVWLAGTLRRVLRDLMGKPGDDGEKGNMVNAIYIVLTVVFVLAWYAYTSHSSNLINLISVCSVIINNAFVDILNPATSQGLSLMFSKDFTFVHSMAKYLHLISQAFIVLGLVVCTLKLSRSKFDSQYLIISFISLGLCISGVVLPFFASSLNATRLYQISLIILAPFCIIGLKHAVEPINRLINLLTRTKLASRFNVILSLFLIVFLLLNTGFIYELLNDAPTSVSLSQENIRSYGNVNSKAEILYNDLNTFDQDVNSVTWCNSMLALELHELYTDLNTQHPCISYGKMYPSIITKNVSAIDPGSYLLFGYPSVRDNVVRESLSETFNMTDISGFLYNNSRIYDNGGGEVYMKE